MSKKKKTKKLPDEIKQEITREVKKALSDSPKNRYDRLVAGAAIVSTLVAVAALLFSIYNYYRVEGFNEKALNQTKTHNLKSVEPILSFVLNNNPNDPVHNFLGMAVDNGGLGPAVIYPALLIYDGEPVGLLEPSSFPNIERKLKGPKGVTVHMVHGTHILMPGKRLMVFWSKDKKLTEIQNYFADIMKHIAIVYPYTSLYEDKFKLCGIPGDGVSDIKITYPKKWYPGSGKAPILITGDISLKYPQN